MSVSGCCRCFCLLLVAPLAAGAIPPSPPPGVLPAKLPLCGLAPAKLFPGQCVYQYRVSTNSKECQQFIDQGLGYFYSYVWMEAARSFETAICHDPNCAMGYWCLSRALDQMWRVPQATTALKKAQQLLPHASYSEKQLITARLQEKGLLPDVGDAEARKKKAIQTLDNLLAVDGEDQEAWYARAQLATGNAYFGGSAASVPFYKALLQVNPLHPGANHELTHFYEGFTRPALGWPYSEKYIESSPGIPHSWHMQSHLATRLGRWDKATKDSLKAAELERAYHQAMNVKPKEDHQFQHHLNILALCLIHDGRFREAQELKKEFEGYGFREPTTWFKLHLAERDFAAALRIAEEFRKRDKTQASHLAALVYLAKGDAERARAEVEILEQAFAERRGDQGLERKVLEARGLLLCRQGGADAGLALLQRAVKATMNDYGHHAWGNGAYYMETWGLAALESGKLAVAEEAFLEAIAHDTGSVRAALGLQTLCERQGRLEEARKYEKLAQKFWKHAEVQAFLAEKSAIAGLGAGTATAAVGGGN